MSAMHVPVHRPRIQPSLERDLTKWIPFFGKIELEIKDADQDRFRKK
jgi:hypothetical protein